MSSAPNPYLVRPPRKQPWASVVHDRDVRAYLAIALKFSRVGITVKGK